MKITVICFALFCCVLSTSSQTNKVTSWVHIIDSLVKLKEYRAALPYLDSVAIQDLNNPWPLEMAVFIYDQLEEYSNAYSVSANLVIIDPLNVNYTNNTGWFALLTANYRQAKQYLFKALRLEKNNYSIYLNLAHVYACTGEMNKGSYYYRYALEYLPNENALINGPLADFVLLKKRKQLKIDTATIANWFRKSFKDASINYVATAILDSIYNLVKEKKAGSNSAEILALKQRFCIEEQKNKVWRYRLIADFYWDIGIASFDKKNFYKAVGLFLMPSKQYSEGISDTPALIKKHIELGSMLGKEGTGWLYKALELAKNSDDKVWQLACYRYLTDRHADKAHWDSSFYYAGLAFSVANALTPEDGDFFDYGKEQAIAQAAAALVRVYSALGKCKEALSYDNIDRSFQEKHLTSASDKFITAQNTAWLIYRCDKYEEAITLARKILLQYPPQQDIDRSSLNELIGCCYYKQGLKDKAAIAFTASIDAYKIYAKANPDDKKIGLMNDHCATALEYLKEIYCTQRNIPALFKTAEESKQSVLYPGLSNTKFPVAIISLQQVQQQLKTNEAVISFGSTSSIRSGYAIGFSGYNTELLIENVAAFKKAASDPAFAVAAKEINGWTSILSDSLFASTREETEIMVAIMGAALQYNRDIGNFRNTRGIVRRSDKEPGKLERNIKACNDFLYALYLAPFEKLLITTKTLYISTEGASAAIPFEALKNSEGKYLGELYNIIYVPSFTIKDLMMQQPEAVSDKMLAIANPVYSGFSGAAMNGRAYDLAQWGFDKWSDLPGTKKELDMILSVQKNSTVYQGHEVNESFIAKENSEGKLKNYRYLHFAVHGMNKLDDYEDNALILTEPINTSKDGFLQFWEVANLHFNARLVCLSACETAFGGMWGSNDMNLTVAFILAGAKSVIATSWKIDDEATGIFMHQFYKALLIEKKLPSEALHKTKLQFINGVFGKEYASPKYWAAFKYIGY